MINPVHRTKKFVRYTGNAKPADNYVTEASGWLGSGVNDINDREIFEGDRVIFGEHGKNGVIIFKNGAFGIAYQVDDKTFFCPLNDTVGFVKIEVVGHIAEDEKS